MSKLINNMGPSDVSEKTWRIYEVSDPTAIESLFGNCTSYEEMDSISEDLYDEIFEEDEEDDE